jgi:hypothetical protein
VVDRRGPIDEGRVIAWRWIERASGALGALILLSLPWLWSRFGRAVALIELGFLIWGTVGIIGMGLYVRRQERIRGVRPTVSPGGSGGPSSDGARHG